MSTVTLTIGFTRNNRTEDYFPAMDGWRAGAAQDVVTVEVPDAGITAEQWAEEVFTATNAPPRVIDRHPVALAIAEALIRSPERSRDLCVGDTVTVAGVLLVCASAGWKRVEDGA